MKKFTDVRCNVSPELKIKIKLCAIAEDTSVSKWLLNLIEEKTSTRPTKIGLVSSEFHLYRATLFAKECGVESVGIPGKTGNFVHFTNYFLREIAGVWHYIILGGQYD